MPPKRILPWKIPDSLLSNQRLNDMIANCLPKNYNFEIHKTIWRIQCLKAKRIALQMPEGLLIFAVPIMELLNEFSLSGNDLDIVIFGDVTYGACCIDDLSAKALDADLLVHYGHSCLVPLESLSILYVFVDIQIDLDHFIRCVNANIDQSTTLALVSTIQFVTSIQAAKDVLIKQHGYSIIIPQSSPLSPGEILGCTSPKINNVDAVIYLGDGRFHLESVMIANPLVPVYRYDPYDKSFTREFYDHKEMRKRRKNAINEARHAKIFGIILGTLGRQGSTTVLDKIRQELDHANKGYIILLLSEIFPNKLKLFGDQVDAWIQIACPRLSIDWGTEFHKPLLTPYEAFVLLNKVNFPSFDTNDDAAYPMDYYSNDSLGPWTPNHPNNRPILNKSNKN